MQVASQPAPGRVEVFFYRQGVVGARRVPPQEITDLVPNHTPPVYGLSAC